MEGLVAYAVSLHPQGGEKWDGTEAVPPQKLRTAGSEIRPYRRQL